MTEALTVLIAGSEPDEDLIQLPGLGLRERSMLLAARLDADLREALAESRLRIHILQTIARRLLQLDPGIRIVAEDDTPSILTSEGLRFGLTPNHTELTLLAHPCPRNRHQGAAVTCFEIIRDVVDLGRFLNRHERICARLDKLELEQTGRLR